MLQAAVVGVGHLGQLHAQKYHQIENVHLAAVVDTNKDRAEKVASDCHCQAYTDYHQLPEDITLVSIAADTKHHCTIARDLLNAGKHLLIEKPMCETSEEARELIQLADSKNLKIQVGHIEQFNPAFISLKKHIDKPVFIECIRLSPFVHRLGVEDVSVIFDVMIHDIDLAISLVGSSVLESATMGAAVVTQDIDIVNSRITFEQGCVVNITASRISNKQERMLRVFQSGCYMAADLQTKEVRIHTTNHNPSSNGEHQFKEQRLSFNDQERDSLKQQIISWVNAITLGSPIQVTGEDGYKALVLAQRISEQAKVSLHQTRR